LPENYLRALLKTEIREYNICKIMVMLKVFYLLRV